MRKIYIALIKEYETYSSTFYDINLRSRPFISKIKNRSLHYNDIRIMYVKLSDKLHCKATEFVQEPLAQFFIRIYSASFILLFREIIQFSYLHFRVYSAFANLHFRDLRVIMRVLQGYTIHIRSGFIC